MGLHGVGEALTLNKVRVGQHRYFSRVVLDFDQPVTKYAIYRGPSGRSLLIVTPSNAKTGLALPGRMPRGLSGISLTPDGDAGSRLRIGVPDGARARSFVIRPDSHGGNRLVLDVLRPASAGRLARIGRVTTIPGRPWRRVKSYTPASRLRPLPERARRAPTSAAPPSPTQPPRAAGAGIASESKPIAPAMPPRTARRETPRAMKPAVSAPMMMADKRSKTKAAGKAGDRGPAGGGSYLQRFTRFLTGSGLEETLPNIHGPIPLRMNNPVHVLLFQFIPERGKLLSQGEQTFRLDMSNSHELGQFNAVDEGLGTSPIDSSIPLEIFTHMEVSTFRLQYDYGILKCLQAGFELPILYHHVNSFANELKELYEHHISGKRKLLTTILEKRPKDLNDTRFFLRDGDKIFFDSDTDSAGLGEMALTAKFGVLPESKWIPETALRVGLKLPTATRQQFGSGGVDGALGVLVEKTIWKTFIAYFNYSVTIPSDPFDSNNLNPRNYYTYWTGALEWSFWKRWALVAQLTRSDAPYETPPNTTADTKLTELLSSPTYVTAGGLRVGITDRWMAMGGFQTDVLGRVGATADETSLFISIGYSIPSLGRKN